MIQTHLTQNTSLSLLRTIMFATHTKRATLLAAIAVYFQWTATAFTQPTAGRVLTKAFLLPRTSAPRTSLLGSKDDDDVNFFERLGNPFGSPVTTSLDTKSETGRSPTSLPPGLTAIQTAVEPIQNAIDDASADWVLSYADLRPETSTSWVGQTFLATNLLYFVAGLILTFQGDYWFGFLTEITSVASFFYHYTQLEARGESKAPTVRLALLFDYILAIGSLTTASVYLLFLPNAPIDIFVAVGLSLGFLGLSWLYESVRPYVLFHGLWHVFGAYAGFLIGTAHNQAEIPTFFS